MSDTRDTSPAQFVPTELLTARLRVQAFQPRHAQAVADFLKRNEAHFRPWDPPRRADDATVAGLTEAAVRAERAWQEDRDVRWVMLPADEPDRVIGRIGLTGITRMAFQSCRLGYQLDAQCQGRGLMAEALRSVIAHAFGPLRLHRIEASYRPENPRSGRVLTRLGFVQTGLAPQYLFIDGAWRDHVQTQLVNAQFDPAWMTAV
jgi:ribosomal-protein-alanine N-acetyltransferase